MFLRLPAWADLLEHRRRCGGRSGEKRKIVGRNAFCCNIVGSPGCKLPHETPALTINSAWYPRGDFKMAKAKSSGTKKSLSKSALLQAVTESVGDGTTRKQVKSVIESLTEIGHRELKKNGLFVLPGFAKFVVVKRPARPARKGINPFTKEPTTFAAKPASKAIKARPIKAIKDAIA